MSSVHYELAVSGHNPDWQLFNLVRHCDCMLMACLTLRNIKALAKINFG